MEEHHEHESATEPVENSRGKKEYEQKKAERMQMKEERNKKETHRARNNNGRLAKTVRNYAIAGAIVGVIGYGIFLFVQNAVPKGEDFSRAVELLPADHIPVGSVLPEYNSNPPSSGPHYGQTARSGFRAQAIPDQNVIHNLEHGDIWISYNPRVSDGAVQSLKRFGAAKVVITPREANDTDIALVAWGRIDAFNIENDEVPFERIQDFITRYVNRGPERVNGASGGI